MFATHSGNQYTQHSKNLTHSEKYAKMHYSITTNNNVENTNYI